MIQISQLKLPAGSDPILLQSRIKKKLRLADGKKFSWHIVRHSIDARKKPNLFDTYSVHVELAGGIRQEEKILARLKDRDLTMTKEVHYRIPSPDQDAGKLEHRPLIVGSGPAGLFCAYVLARAGYRPLVIERGRSMEGRIQSVEHFWKTGQLDPGTNIQFGEGGAGTFSDGKLNSNIKDHSGRTSFVLETFHAHGAPEDILYENTPHIGTDLLRDTIVNMREDLILMGAEVRFETTLTDVLLDENEHVKGAVLQSAEGREEIACEVLVLAPGHSARDTIERLFEKKLPMEQKNFAVGFRVSHPQSLVNECQYGLSDPEQMQRLHLPSANYKLVQQMPSGRGVYSFCMCPGGYVVNASSEEGRLAVNGMSDYLRDSKRANAAIVMTVGSQEFGAQDPLAGMRYQKALEERAFDLCQGKVPVEKYTDFRDKVTLGKGETNPGVETGNPGMKIIENPEELCIRGQAAYGELHTLFPDDMNQDFVGAMEAFDRKIKGFAGEEALVIGLESRTSSPVRIPRDEGLESAWKGLYPCGEGAGFAGGITSAAVDGIKVAEAIVQSYAPAAL